MHFMTSENGCNLMHSIGQQGGTVIPSSVLYFSHLKTGWKQNMKSGTKISLNVILLRQDFCRKLSLLMMMWQAACYMYRYRLADESAATYHPVLC